MMSKYVVGLGRANRQYISESRERVKKKQKTKIVEHELIYISCHICFVNTVELFIDLVFTWNIIQTTQGSIYLCDQNIPESRYQLDLRKIL